MAHEHKPTGTAADVPVDDEDMEAQLRREPKRNVPPRGERIMPPVSEWGKHYAGWSKHAHPTIRCTMLRSPRAADLSVLKQYGISSALLEAATDTDEPDDEAMFELSVRLLELVITKRNAGVPHPVRGHQLIPDSLVNEAVVRMVEPSVPAPLLELLRFQLRAVGRMANAPRAPRARQRAVILCAFYGKKVGRSRMARLLDVDASTVSRWIRDQAFRTEVGRLVSQLDPFVEQTGPLGESSTWPPCVVALCDLGPEDVEQLWQRYKHLVD